MGAALVAGRAGRRKISSDAGRLVLTPNPPEGSRRARRRTACAGTVTAMLVAWAMTQEPDVQGVGFCWGRGAPRANPA